MESKKEKKFIKKPYYPGGSEAYRAFIKKHLKYPKSAIENGVEGVVVIKYAIDHKGQVTKTSVISSVGSGCDEEAIRVVKMLRFEVPETPRKLRVTFNKTAKIKFALPKKKSAKKTSPSHIKYVITESESKSKSYSYSINWNS